MNTQPISIMAMTSELLSRASIIKLPEGTKYNIQDTLNVILHAATSVTNSLESASIDLRLKNPDKNIPSADSIHDYINSNSIDYIMSAFRHINTEIIELAHLSGTVQDIAIDFHDIPYYGEKNTCGVRGIKPKNGTCWGYSFCTVDIVGETKLTLDAININGLTKNYAVLIESLLQRIKSMGILIKTLYLDREFFNLSTISTLHRPNTQYIIAATANRKINRMLNDHKNKFGSGSTVLEYQFKKGGPKFSIVAILNPNYDTKAKKDKGKGNNEYFLFATNLNVNSISEFIKIIPEEYKKRWNIETGYKIKNVFKIRTCSKSTVVRILFFLLQCLLFNILNLLKTGLMTNVYELKSFINNGILIYIQEGYKSLCRIPIAVFLNRLQEYNEGRIQALRERLAQI